MSKPRKKVKHTFFLHEGQMDALNTAHPDIPAAEIIRRLIDAYIAKITPSLNRQRLEAISDINFEEPNLDV